MAEINQASPGFLDLLDAKTGGLSPREWEGRLTTNLDMGPFYELASRDHRQVVTAGVMTGPGSMEDMPVPDGEFWGVQAISAAMTVPTIGSVVQFRIGFFGPSSEGVQVFTSLFTSPQMTTVIANQVVNLAAGYLGRPVWLRSGEGIRVAANLYDDLSAGTAKIRALVSRVGAPSR